jgi:Uncharacterised protein family (UPF0182)
MVEKRTIVEQPWRFAGGNGSAAGTRPAFRHLLGSVIAAAVLLIFVLGIVTDYLQKWLWMRQLNYFGVFWTLLSVQWAMFCSAFVFVFLYLWLNIRQAVRSSSAFRGNGQARGPALWSEPDGVAQTGVGLSSPLLKLAVVLVSAGIALFFAIGFYANWDTYLRFRYGGSFGVADPLFGVDVGFYLFYLPFYEMLQTSLALLTVLALAAVLLTYVLFGLLRVGSGGRIEAAGNTTSIPLLASSTAPATRLIMRRGSPRGSWSPSRRRHACCSRSISSAHVSCHCSSDRASTWLYMSLASSCSPASLRSSLCSRANWRSRPLSEALHRVHTQGLPARTHPGNLLSGAGGFDAGGAR